jgi:thymidylate synthase (FAD)
MNIIKPYANLLTPRNHVEGLVLLQHIEWCGRISHRAEDKQTAESYERFIKAVVLEHGDWSIVEHATACVDFYVDRGITHEIVRHRLFSFTQESTRFVNYQRKMEPSFVFPFPEDETRNQWTKCIEKCEETYKDLVENWKVSPQIARSVFPNALASRLIVTGNLRNWRHFFIMRTTKEAHPQMREVTIPLLAQFKERIPILFDDIEPLAKQSEGMKKGR